MFCYGNKLSLMYNQKPRCIVGEYVQIFYACKLQCRLLERAAAAMRRSQLLRLVCVDNLSCTGCWRRALCVYLDYTSPRFTALTVQSRVLNADRASRHVRRACLRGLPERLESCGRSPHASVQRQRLPVAFVTRHSLLTHSTRLTLDAISLRQRLTLMFRLITLLRRPT